MLHRKSDSIAVDEASLGQLVARATDARMLIESDRILISSQRCRELFRSTEDGLTASNLVSLFSPRSHARVRRTVSECLHSGVVSPVSSESIVRGDGTTLEVDCIFSPAGKGHPESVLALLWPSSNDNRTTKALKASERRFRSFIENVFDGVYQSTPEGDLLMVNPALVRMLGYESEEELLKVNIARDLYADPGDREPLLRQTEVTDQRRDIELRLRRKDGGAIVCLENTRVVRRSNGEVMYYEGTLKDITEWKKVQQELRKSEERYKAFIKQSTEGIWCLELDEPISIDLPVEEQLRLLNERAFVKECNYELARQLGFERPDEILGARIEDLFDVSSQSFLHSFVQNGYRLVNVESPRQIGGDRFRFLQTTIVGIVEDRFLLRSWGTQRDVTERKLAERRLRESEERYRQYFNEGIAGHFISEPGGRIVACNKAFAKILGFGSVDEVLQANAPDLYSTASDRENLLNKIRSRGRLDTIELVLKRKDGESITVVENVQGTFGPDGSLLQLIGFVVDITEKKQLEAQLREAQKMETLGTLSGGVAHDFNNILAVVRGYIALLRRNRLVDESGNGYMEAIETAVKRGAGVVRQLLTFAREDQHEMSPVDVRKIASEVLAFARVTMPETITLDLRSDEDVPWVMGDETQINQAILNLVVNARDAMPGGGALRIEVCRRTGADLSPTFPEAESDFYACIRVSDEGAGIPESIHARIFEPFYTTKDIGKGSGLGLAVVYGVARSHLGFVDVKPNGPRGSIFSLFFPGFVEGPKEPPAVPETEVSAPGSETVLLIEDETMLLELLSMLLESNGYKVLKAEDGEAAVDLYRENMKDIAVVLSDMGLPKLGGWEVFQQMKEMNPNVKSILASGYMDPSIRTKLLSAGAVDFIQKPYVPDDILRRIRLIIDESAKNLQ